jgi:hypothetical protein
LELQRALEMSREAAGGGSSSGTTETTGQTFVDPEFVNQLLNTMSPDDPLYQAALAQLQGAAQNPEEKKDEENSKKRKKDETD